VTFEALTRSLSDTRSAVVASYVRRLLTPPLPGDGLLVVGLVEGLIGWSLSWLFVSAPSLAPFGLIRSIVALWVLLTAGIVIVGVGYTAPTVRRNRIWLVWAGLNATAVGINLLAVAGQFPGPFANVPLVSDSLGLGYWQPWFVVLGLGYLSTALYNWSNPQLRRSERAVYAVGGGVALIAVSPWVWTPTPGANLFVVGGLLHVVPMGYDVAADLALIIRQTG